MRSHIHNPCIHGPCLYPYLYLCIINLDSRQHKGSNKSNFFFIIVGLPIKKYSKFNQPICTHKRGLIICLVLMGYFGHNHKLTYGPWLVMQFGPGPSQLGQPINQEVNLVHWVQPTDLIRSRATVEI